MSREDLLLEVIKMIENSEVDENKILKRQNVQENKPYNIAI